MTAKKKKPTRYDAAYDHLGPLGMGFRKGAIRKKIDSLLKVYGEAAGWVFIEEGFYKVLIDCLLEDSDPEPVLLLKGGPEDEQDLGNNQQQPMREDSTIIEKRITRSASGAAKKSYAVDIYEPTDSEPMTEEVKKRLEKKQRVASFLFGRGDSVPLLPAAGEDKSQRELTGLDDGKLVSAQKKKLQKKRSQRKFDRLSAFGNDGKLAQEEELQHGNDNAKLVSAPEEELQDRNDDGKLVSAQEEELQKKGRSRRKFVCLSAQEEELQDQNDDGKLVPAQEEELQKKKRSRRKFVCLSPQEEELQEKLTGPVQDATQYCMRRPCFGLLNSGDDDGENYVYSETKASLRERMMRERSVIPHHGVQRTWWNVVGAI